MKNAEQKTDLVATAYRKGLKDAIWLAGVLLACASVVCMLGVAP